MRSILSHTFTAVLAFVTLTALAFSGEVVARQYTMMGTFVEIKVAAPTGREKAASKAIELAAEEMRALIDVVNWRNPKSDVARLTDQAVLILRVPQFTDVTVAAGGLLTTSAWDGAVGGILAFRANGTVLVEDGGTIAVDSLGYWGGDTGPTFNCDSYQGESYAGVGEGPGNSGGCASYNEAWGYWVNNWGGGGAHITGGGGAYGPGATAGDSWTGGGATPPYAGIEYGDAELTGLYFGSGGGGVWNGQDGDPGEDPGPGGDGAGILLIGAAAMQADGAGALTAQGGSTVAWAWGNWTYGAGGGAGGAIFVVADDLTLAADAVDASGGFGQDDYTRDGGDGGVGRIRIDFGTLNGFPFASPDADAALADGALPDAGFSAAVPPP